LAGKPDGLLSSSQLSVAVLGDRPCSCAVDYDHGRRGCVVSKVSIFYHRLALVPRDAGARDWSDSGRIASARRDEAILHFEKFVQLRPDHAGAYYNLGNALLQKGRVDDAVAHFEKALKLNPVLAEAENDLGNALFRKGQIDEAILHFQKFLELCLDRGEKDRAEGHFNLGTALLQKGQIGEAIDHYRKAVKLRPDYAEAQNNLAGVLLQEGLVDEAISHLQKVLELRPNHGEAHSNLGNALLQKGQIGEAIAHYEKALQIDPRSISVLNQLAWVLATNSEAQVRNGAKAIELARQADQFSGGQNPIILHTLAAAYAESGQFSQAVEAAQGALKLAVIEGNTALAEALRQVIGLYQAGKPLSPMSRVTKADCRFYFLPFLARSTSGV